MQKATIGKIILAAVISADGGGVETFKQSCAPRCLFRFDDTPHNRALIEAYELGKPVQVSQKAIWQAYLELIAETKRLSGPGIALQNAETQECLA
jgi:hypothetical protein